MGVIVELTDAELETVEAWAREVTGRAWERGYVNRYGGERNRTYEEDLENRVQALAAEVAVAKHTGLRWWNPRRQSGRDSPDVGEAIGVRWSRRPYLLVHDEDPDEFELYLVTGSVPRMDLRGKILARDAKRREWWKEEWRNPCYAVPERELRRPSHTCGWSRDELGAWRCTGDYYGGSGCGARYVGMTPQGWQGPEEVTA